MTAFRPIAFHQIRSSLRTNATRPLVPKGLFTQSTVSLSAPASAARCAASSVKQAWCTTASRISVWKSTSYQVCWRPIFPILKTMFSGTQVSPCSDDYSGDCAANPPSIMCGRHNQTAHLWLVWNLRWWTFQTSVLRSWISARRISRYGALLTNKVPPLVSGNS